MAKKINKYLPGGELNQIYIDMQNQEKIAEYYKHIDDNYEYDIYIKAYNETLGKLYATLDFYKYHINDNELRPLVEDIIHSQK